MVLSLPPGEDSENLLNLCVYNTVLSQEKHACGQYTGLHWKLLVNELVENWSCQVKIRFLKNHNILVRVESFDEGGYWGSTYTNVTEGEHVGVALCKAALLFWLTLEEKEVLPFPKRGF